jgi:hypothetical protein
MATLAPDSNLCALITPVAPAFAENENARNRGAAHGAFHLSAAKSVACTSRDAFVARLGSFLDLC